MMVIVPTTQMLSGIPDGRSQITLPAVPVRQPQFSDGCSAAGERCQVVTGIDSTVLVCCLMSLLSRCMGLYCQLV